MAEGGGLLPGDYDDDPGRFAANQEATRRFSRVGDVHPVVVRRFADETCGSVVDIGGGNGVLARALGDNGVRTVVVDRAELLKEAPRPAVRADATRLPFRDGCFDGAAALWMLYHLPDPLLVLREAQRVVRAGGVVAVCTSSRFNDPELAPVLPGWGTPLTFDAENAAGLLGAVFEDVDVQRWDEPLVDIPDRAALKLFLRGRGLS
ncbi:class I SAM-dependent methyltransferase, partial [Actinomadura adrarensis]